LCVAAQWSFAWALMVHISVGALRRMHLALVAAMEALVAVSDLPDLRSVDDGSNLARVQAVDLCWWWTLQVLPWWLQVQTMLLLLRNAGCCCGVGTRGHGGRRWWWLLLFAGEVTEHYGSGSFRTEV